MPNSAEDYIQSVKDLNNSSYNHIYEYAWNSAWDSLAIMAHAAVMLDDKDTKLKVLSMVNELETLRR